MTDERIIEDLAGIDGWAPEIGKEDWLGMSYDANMGDWRIPCWHQKSNYWSSIENYLDPESGHNPLHRIIKKMDVITGDKFAYILGGLVGTQITYQVARNWYLISNATVAQTAEAILKAYGKWED